MNLFLGSKYIILFSAIIYCSSAVDKNYGKRKTDHYDRNPWEDHRNKRRSYSVHGNKALESISDQREYSTHKHKQMDVRSQRSTQTPRSHEKNKDFTVIGLRDAIEIDKFLQRTSMNQLTKEKIDRYDKVIYCYIALSSIANTVEHDFTLNLPMYDRVAPKQNLSRYVKLNRVGRKRLNVTPCYGRTTLRPTQHDELNEYFNYYYIAKGHHEILLFKMVWDVDPDKDSLVPVKKILLGDLQPTNYYLNQINRYKSWLIYNKETFFPIMDGKIVEFNYLREIQYRNTELRDHDPLLKLSPSSRINLCIELIGVVHIFKPNFVLDQDLNKYSTLEVNNNQYSLHPLKFHYFNDFNNGNHQKSMIKCHDKSSDDHISLSCGGRPSSAIIYISKEMSKSKTESIQPQEDKHYYKPYIYIENIPSLLPHCTTETMIFYNKTLPYFPMKRDDPIFFKDPSRWDGHGGWNKEPLFTSKTTFMDMAISNRSHFGELTNKLSSDDNQYENVKPKNTINDYDLLNDSPNDQFQKGEGSTGGINQIKMTKNYDIGKESFLEEPEEGEFLEKSVEKDSPEEGELFEEPGGKYSLEEGELFEEYGRKDSIEEGELSEEYDSLIKVGEESLQTMNISDSKSDKGKQVQDMQIGSTEEGNSEYFMKDHLSNTDSLDKGEFNYDNMLTDLIGGSTSKSKSEILLTADKLDEHKESKNMNGEENTIPGSMHVQTTIDTVECQKSPQAGSDSLVDHSTSPPMNIKSDQIQTVKDRGNTILPDVHSQRISSSSMAQKKPLLNVDDLLQLGYSDVYPSRSSIVNPYSLDRVGNNYLEDEDAGHSSYILQSDDGEEGEFKVVDEHDD